MKLNYYAYKQEVLEMSDDSIFDDAIFLWDACINDELACQCFRAVREITIIQEFVGYNWLALKFK